MTSSDRRPAWEPTEEDIAFYDVYGDWDPLTPSELARLMTGFPRPWWLVGGHAIEAFTAAEPLILVLEDLQWSDSATVDWLAYVARRRDTARLLVLGTYRPLEAVLHAAPLRRAIAVRDYLISQGVAASSIDVAGLGSSRPAVDNATAEGRARNRRVEIVVSGGPLDTGRAVAAR